MENYGETISELNKKVRLRQQDIIHMCVLIFTSTMCEHEKVRKTRGIKWFATAFPANLCADFSI